MSEKQVRNGDVMLDPGHFAVVKTDFILKEVLEIMTKYPFGIACVVNDDGDLEGVFTDGDMRRLTLQQQKPWSALFVDDIMIHSNAKPLTVSPDGDLVDSIRLMEQKFIRDLPVVDADGKLVGLLHLHQAIKHLLGI